MANLVLFKGNSYYLCDNMCEEEFERLKEEYPDFIIHLYQKETKGWEVETNYLVTQIKDLTYVA